MPIRCPSRVSPCVGLPVGLLVAMLAAMLIPVVLVPVVSAQEVKNTGSGQSEPGNPNARTPVDGAESRAKLGYLIDVPMPLDGSASTEILAQLKRLSDSAPDRERVTVVLRYKDDLELGKETAFEDALRLARAMTQVELRAVRIVSLVEGEVTGHATLPIIASDALLVSAGGVIVDASAGEESVDETIVLSYQSIAARRGLFPSAIVSSLVDPGLELAQISKVGGGQEFVAGAALDDRRESGDVFREEIWSVAGVPLRLDAKQLRKSRIASGLVDSLDAAAERLDLAKLNPIETQLAVGAASAVHLDIVGAVASNRTRRWQSNLSSTLTSGGVNTWVITIDSPGGSLDNSATLAGWFSEPQPPLRTVAGLVRGEARGDAALIAVSCKPLFMAPDARLGGPGAESLSSEKLGRYRELIEQIGRSTRRSSALIRGLLDPDLAVYHYTHRKTGRIRYATEDDLVAGTENPEEERQKWKRGERVELAEGLSASEAVALGLADGESRSLEDTSRRIGLSGSPPAVADRGFVRFVEKIGRSHALAFLLLFIGFSALSAEASVPGLSVPGFIAMVCFGLYFWIKFLAGTAEWLELVAFSLGIICIAIEVFVLPGFGVFGIGGLALTVLGIVLMSQTFVVPRNVYQLEVLTKGIWVALGGAGGLIGGFLVMRMMMPHVPVLRGLVMEAPDEAMISESEKLGDFSNLLGQSGEATTPLHPSGKARFGDQVVQVVSDGALISRGESIRVREVLGTKVVVEALDS